MTANPRRSAREGSTVTVSRYVGGEACVFTGMESLP